MRQTYNCIFCEHMTSKKCGKIVCEKYISGAVHTKKPDRRCIKKRADIAQKNKR